MRTENIIIDLKNLEDIIDFSNLDKNQELLVIKTKKYLVNSKEKHLKMLRLMNLLL